MKKKIFWGLVVVFGVIIALFIKINTEKASIFSVQVGDLKNETIIEKLSTTGVLIPNRTQALNGKGNVVSLKVKVGDKVDKDKVLAIYDNGLQLTAPFAGTITSLNIQENEADTNAQLGRPSIQVDDLSTLKVLLALSSSEASAVNLKQHAEIKTTDKIYTGTVAEKDPIALNTQTSAGTAASLRAVVTFDGEPQNLFAGFDIDVDITTNTVDNCLALPIEALTYNTKNEPIVYVITDGKAKETKITTGIQSDQLIEVKDGLTKTQKVILSPNSTIKNNTQVVTE